ncbi:MAG: DUF4331 domain-containing protein, partial [Candidatus Eremiobacteraeota bacterium]|nr:DUF4331 domain-containing protein [Candidatus Eremiobacteraeota bacterium]
MKKFFALATTLSVLALIAFVATLYSGRTALSSDHQETPLVIQRPGADITDMFVFPAANPNNVVLAMDIHALIPRNMAGGYYFDPAVMYQFKISTTGSAREDRVVQIRAVGGPGNQHLEMYGPAAPAMVGTQSRWVGSPQSFAFNRVSDLRGGVKAFGGPRKDPFFLDLAQLLKLLPDRNAFYHDPGTGVPPPSAKCFRNPGRDFFHDYNVLALVVEMPRSMLAGPGGKLGVIRVYTTTSLPNGNGTYIQEERTARPAVKESFEAFKDHAATNRSAPWNDALLSHSIVAFMTAKPPNGAGRSMQLATALQHVLIPDELAADLSKQAPAGYLGVETQAGNFGGRGPSTVVIDPSLQAIFGSAGAKLGLAPDDGRETPCLTSNHVPPDDRGVTNHFPYLGAQIYPERRNSSRNRNDDSASQPKGWEAEG